MKQKSKYNIFQNIKYLLEKSKEFDKYILVLLVVYSFMIAMVPFLTAFLSKYVVDELVEREYTLVIGVIIIFAVVGTMTKGIAPCIKAIYEPRIMGVREKFINLLNRKVMEMDYEYTENPEIGKKLELAMRAVADNVSGIEGMLNTLFGMIGVFISILIYSIYIVNFKWFLFLFLIAVLLGEMFSFFRQKKYEIKFADDIAACNKKKDYFYNQMSDFQNGKEIRLYTLNRFLTRKYQEANEDYLEIHKKILGSRGVQSSLESLCKAIKYFAVYVFLFAAYKSQEITIGQFSFYFSAMTIYNPLVQQFVKAFIDINAQSVFINDFRDFLELEEYLSEEGLVIDEIKKITFENVSFAYPGTDKYVLKNINLTITQGERLALVGLNGAGKTTMVKLLCGFYKPTSGVIRVNDCDIRRINRASYIACVSALFQDYKFFSFSIKENITATTNEADQARLQSVIDSLGLEAILGKLMNGIDTTIYRVLDKDGVELSGGQGQKIAFARALYKDNSFILLDEPTAALDVIAETKMYDDFNRLTKGKTVIFISHRLASTKFCDRIVTLYDGEIDECGSHEELMKRNGRYADLFHLQASKYV